MTKQRGLLIKSVAFPEGMAGMMLVKMEYYFSGIVCANLNGLAVDGRVMRLVSHHAIGSEIMRSKGISIVVRPHATRAQEVGRSICVCPASEMV